MEATFPYLDRLVGTPSAMSHIRTLFDLHEKGTDVSLLSQLERRLADLKNPSWNLFSLGKMLGGPKEKFSSAVPEIFGLAWFARKGLLREVGVETAPGETVGGKLSTIDGLIGVADGPPALAEMKSLQAHVQSYLDKICAAVEARLVADGRTGLKMRPHITGKPNVEYVRKNEEVIKQAALEAIPEMLTRTVTIWKNPELRLRAELRKGRVQSGFWSVLQEIRQRQEILWKQSYQASQKRPFLLVLVRTPDAGTEVEDMAQLLGWALFGTEAEPRAEPIFGSRSTEKIEKVGQTKAFVQEFISGVLFIDERDDTSKSATFVNPFAVHPLSGDLLAKLA